VMSMVSFKAMLTYRSFMSRVISLCLSVIVSFTRSLARLVDLRVVFSISRSRCFLRIS